MQAKKSKPESEQHAVDGDLENKKRKKKSSDKEKVWILRPTTARHGFLAHEVSTVL